MLQGDLRDSRLDTQDSGEGPPESMTVADAITEPASVAALHQPALDEPVVTRRDHQPRHAVPVTTQGGSEAPNPRVSLFRHM